MPITVTTITDKTVLLVGLGLIGGSVARALRAANPKQRILACDTNAASLALALAEKVIDEAGELIELAPRADLIVLAVPPLSIATILQQLAALDSERAVITDVGSVKSHLLEAIGRLPESMQRRIVPGHPIAGSEQSGFSASEDGLFQKRNVILTPLSQSTPEAVSLVHDMWRELGANVLGMSLHRHDEVLAATSHLPHLLAFAIVDVLVNQEKSEDIFRYAAGGFADFSRLASSDAKMWSDIFIANSDAMNNVLDDYIHNLSSLKKAIAEKDHDHMMKVFSRAKNAREKFINQHFSPGSDSVMENAQINFEVDAGGEISGKIRVPGDKSISHRSIIFGSIAEGVTQVRGFLEGEDALNTVAAFREMGVTIVGPEEGALTIHGVGMDGLKAPRSSLYMGNSGTAMRLLAGLLAAQKFDSELSGDESLNERPMNRVANPLREMGAKISAQDDGTPPLHIEGTQLHGIEYSMNVASAQIKSCLLLAGLYATGETAVIEPAPCRDHTERMLSGFGVAIDRDIEAGRCSVVGGQKLQATQIDVPADISSAAFFLVAASITPGASLLLEHVGVNPTRIGVINILKLMGADIELQNQRVVGGEPVADLAVRYAPLHGIDIPAAEIPLAIDEFPVLFVAAACAEGETVLRGAAELRVKESDRLEAMAVGLTSLGIDLESYEDGIRIHGGKLTQGRVDSRGDHRIAMAFVVAALRAEGAISIENCANVATSFPGFVELAQSVGMRVRAETVS